MPTLNRRDISGLESIDKVYSDNVAIMIPMIVNPQEVVPFA